MPLLFFLLKLIGYVYGAFISWILFVTPMKRRLLKVEGSSIKIDKNYIVAVTSLGRFDCKPYGTSQNAPMRCHLLGPPLRKMDGNGSYAAFEFASKLRGVHRARSFTIQGRVLYTLKR